MKDIEQLLSQTTHTPKLSLAMKERLYARVLEKEARMHRLSWTTRMRGWFIVPTFTLGALGVATFAIWFVARSLIIDMPGIYGNQHQGQKGDSEHGVFAHVQSIDEYILGRGGMVGERYWTIESLISLSHARPRSSQEGVLRIPDQRVHEIAELFRVHPENVRTDADQDRVCLEERMSIGLSMSCLFVSTKGIVNFEQREAEANNDGRGEALRYVVELTGTSVDEWSVLPVQDVSHAEHVKNWKQYYIVPRNARTFTGYGFHIALAEEKLVSFTGAYIQPVYTTVGQELISEYEAVERVREDFAAQDVHDQQWGVGYIMDPLSNEQLSVSKHLTIEITQVVLESALFETLHENGGNIIVLPVYLVRGKVKGTDTLFEVVVDASLRGRVSADRLQFITHPFQLLSL